MNTSPSTSPGTPHSGDGKRNKLLQIALPLGLGVVVLAVGWAVMTHFGLDRKMVEKQLEAYKEFVAEHLAQRGMEGEFTYDDVSVSGSLIGRHATIKNARISVRPQGAAAELSSSFGTEEVTLVPEALDFTKIRIELPKPLVISEPGQKERRIVSSSPLVLSVEQEVNEQKKLITRHSAALPGQMQWQEAGEGEEPVTIATIEFAPESTLSGHVDEKGDEIAADVAMGQVRALDEQGNEVLTIASAVMSYHEGLKADAENIAQMTWKATVGDVVLATAQQPAPLSFTVDMEYEGPPFDPAMPQPMALAGQKSAIKVRTLDISMKPLQVTANADFMTEEGDILPIGTAQVNVVQYQQFVQALKDWEVVDDSAAATLNTIASKISGQPAEAITDLSIAIKREKGQAFYIGAVTFEELFALLLSDQLQLNAPEAPEAKDPDETQPPVPQDAAPADPAAPAAQEPATPSAAPTL